MEPEMDMDMPAADSVGDPLDGGLDSVEVSVEPSLDELRDTIAPPAEEPELEDMGAVEQDLGQRIEEFKSNDQELRSQVEELQDQLSGIEDCLNEDVAAAPTNPLVVEQVNYTVGPDVSTYAKRKVAEGDPLKMLNLPASKSDDKGAGAESIKEDAQQYGEEREMPVPQAVEKAGQVIKLYHFAIQVMDKIGARGDARELAAKLHLAQNEFDKAKASGDLRTTTAHLLAVRTGLDQFLALQQLPAKAASWQRFAKKAGLIKSVEPDHRK